MAKLYKEIFADTIKEQINMGQFNTKQELIEFLHNFNTTYFDNPALMQSLKQAGINLKELNVNEVTQELLSYYDKKNVDTTSLNLEGISQVEIDGTDYIKINNGDGTYDLLDDSMNNDNFVKQFEDRQNESYNYQTNNGVKNRNEIIDDMKKDKEEVKLTSSNNVNTRELTPEERREFGAIMRMNDANVINFVVDPVRNIYINKNTGELFYAHKNKEGKMEVRKAEEVTTQTLKQDVEVVDDMENDSKVTVEQPDDGDFENLDDFELQYIVDNRLDTLTPEQKVILFRLIEKRKERKMQDNQEKVKEERGPQKVMMMNMFNKPYNGFTSIIYFSLLTLLFGIGMILYLVMKIYL